MKAQRTMAREDMQTAPLRTPTYLGANTVTDIAGALTAPLADAFGLYLKTKNTCWGRISTTITCCSKTWIDEAERRAWFLFGSGQLA